MTGNGYSPFFVVFQQGDVNVICVDWENGANLPNYVRAAVNARLVGRQVSLLVTAINGMLGSKNADFHLIGFSLGAHVAGFAGSELRNVSRITGSFPYSKNSLFDSIRTSVNVNGNKHKTIRVNWTDCILSIQDWTQLVRSLKTMTREFDSIRPTRIWLMSSIPTARKSTWEA